jgi:hypothetical protein
MVCFIEVEPHMLGPGRVFESWGTFPLAAELIAAWPLEAGRELHEIAPDLLPPKNSLKFVVNAHLPTGPWRQQHYISESS